MSKKAIIVAGGWPGHEPDKLSVRFKKMLENEDFEVNIHNELEVYGDKEYLMQQNLIIPMWTQGELYDEYHFNISRAVESGVGLAGIHGGMCDSFRWNTCWQFMTGAQWVSHPGVKWYDNPSVLDPELLARHPVPPGGFDIEYTVNIDRNSSSPITEGIEDFTITSEQYYLHVDPANHVLATTIVKDGEGPHNANGPVTMPVVFTRLWGKGKIFYSSLGHLDHFFDDIPQIAELTRRGFLWAAK